LNDSHNTDDESIINLPLPAAAGNDVIWLAALEKAAAPRVDAAIISNDTIAISFDMATLRLYMRGLVKVLVMRR
jgi:hypothetical protein